MTSATPNEVDPRSLQPINATYASSKRTVAFVIVILLIVVLMTIGATLVVRNLTAEPTAQQLNDSYVNGLAQGNLKGYDIGYQRGLEDAPTVVGITLRTPWDELANMNAKFIPGAVPPLGVHVVIHDLIEITPEQYESVLEHYSVTDDMTKIHLSEAVLNSMTFAEQPNHDYTLVFGN